jgi:predicted dehydrogenase
LKFKSGVVGTFVISDASPSPYSFKAGTGENPMIPQSGKDFYRIFGTEVTLSVGDMVRWSYDEKESKSWTGGLSSEHVEVRSEIPFDEQVAHFVRVVRDGEEPVCSGQEGLRALVICDAVQRALETGDPVDIKAYI